MKLPKTTEDEQTIRDSAMQEGLKTAVQVPLNLAMLGCKLLPDLLELAKLGNINCKSDLQVAVRCLATGIHGAIHNVKINLADVTDEAYATTTTDNVDLLVIKTDQMTSQILALLQIR
jgi:glutamate formiminotransferase/formiminotetrahydrofolate cyclodeaminase